MKLLPAIALLAFAMSAHAQHGGHAGSFASRGFSGSAGFSSRPAFSGSRSFTRPAPPTRYGSYVGFRTYGQPGRRSPYNQNQFAPGRPSYNPRASGTSRGFDQDRGRNQDRDRFDARRRQFQNWYVASYPYWPGYPYLFDPNAYNLGLYNWGDSDDSAPDISQPGNSEPGNDWADQNGSAPAYPYPDQRPPYPGEGYAAPVGDAGSAAPPVPDQPLTVIFKSGRAPIKVRNYLMTAKALTDLDSKHYEQIPLDQIDVAATERLNSAAGIDFQVPGA